MILLVHTQPFLFWFPAISFMVLLWALMTAPWRQLGNPLIRLHLLVGSTIALGLFWSWLAVNVRDIYAVHPLLMTTLVFVFGLRLSLVAGTGALVIMHLLTASPWENIAFHYLVSVLTPVWVTGGILWLINKIHWQNLFIYTLGGSFIGGMVTQLASGGMCLLLLWVSNSTLLWPVWDNAYLFLLLAFPEGFCNGAMVSTVTILRPDLVKTYDDDFYLDGK